MYILTDGVSGVSPAMRFLAEDENPIVQINDQTDTPTEEWT